MDEGPVCVGGGRSRHGHPVPDGVCRQCGGAVVPGPKAGFRGTVRARRRGMAHDAPHRAPCQALLSELRKNRADGLEAGRPWTSCPRHMERQPDTGIAAKGLSTGRGAGLAMSARMSPPWPPSGRSRGTSFGSPAGKSFKGRKMATVPAFPGLAAIALCAGFGASAGSRAGTGMPSSHRWRILPPRPTVRGGVATTFPRHRRTHFPRAPQDSESAGLRGSRVPWDSGSSTASRLARSMASTSKGSICSAVPADFPVVFPTGHRRPRRSSGFFDRSIGLGIRTAFAIRPFRKIRDPDGLSFSDAPWLRHRSGTCALAVPIGFPVLPRPTFCGSGRSSGPIRTFHETRTPAWLRVSTVPLHSRSDCLRISTVPWDSGSRAAWHFARSMASTSIGNARLRPGIARLPFPGRPPSASPHPFHPGRRHCRASLGEESDRPD
jgi:hypothetical protein